MNDNSHNPNARDGQARNGSSRIDEIVARLCDARWLSNSPPPPERESAESIEQLEPDERAVAADHRWIDALLYRLAEGTASEDRSRVDRVIEAIERGQQPRVAILDLIEPSDESHPLLPDASPAAPGTPSGFRWIPFVLAILPLAMLGVVGARLLIDAGKPADERQLHRVAKVVSTDNCVWATQTSEALVGDVLPPAAQLDLLSGVIKLKFDAGATVVVEGPASFGLVSSKRMRLRHGALVVRTDENNKEFVVDSPDAAIVDLGTSFGVHCDANGATEVSVFEGAVEVRPTVKSDQGHVLGLGASARISPAENGPNIETIASDDRFASLVDVLWDEYGFDVDDRDGSAVVAEFNDAPIPGTVDTFYGSTRGRGWRTPWMAAGNPVGEIREFDSLGEEGDPYLHMKFRRAKSRLVAREYGSRPDFDPLKPHVISWRWRFDGDPEHFGRHFKDRVLFYGSPRFSVNTSPANSWTIRLATADEVGGRFRAGHPMHWCFFDSHPEEGGVTFNRRTLVDSGMTLKPGVVYYFAVAVYPEEAKYDVAIRDDEQTVIKKNLSFRNRRPEPSNVAHFGIRSEDETADLAFSLDAVHIEQLSYGDWFERVQ